MQRKLLLFVLSLLLSLSVVSVLDSASANNIEPGDFVNFGTYPQEKNETEVTPISWRVLAVEGNKAFLLSEMALDDKAYDESGYEDTWEECTLRKWLNEDFLSKAFSSEEQTAIFMTEVDNSKSQGNPKWKATYQNNTQDKIFLLSYQEMQMYSEWVGGCKPTKYAITQGAKGFNNDSCYWWLRSPGEKTWQVACVDDRHIFSAAWLDKSRGVRPALWVDIDILENRNTSIEPQYATFGKYPQNKDGNDMTPIQWQIMSTDGNRVLIVSSNILDLKQYNSKYESVTWETCSLRKWLNDDFVKIAFSPEERAAIIEVDVDNSKEQGHESWSRGGSNNTHDKVFLLGNLETIQLFRTDAERVCKPTEYAMAVYADIWKGNTWNAPSWWLRSPGEWWDEAAYVSHKGSLMGERVDLFEGIRPAMWVDQKAIMK